MKRHDPATCSICMDEVIWDDPLNLFGEDAPNSWATTPDSMQWMQDHKDAGYHIILVDNYPYEESVQ